MYRPSKYNISQASLEFFANRFNGCLNHKNLEWRFTKEESFDNDGYFLDLNSGKTLGYDWEIRDNYFDNGIFMFNTVRQFDRKMSKSSIKLSLQGDRDCFAFIAVWHADLKKSGAFLQESITDTGNQNASVWETDVFRIYKLDNIAIFKNMIAFAIKHDIYDGRAFEMDTKVF